MARFKGKNGAITSGASDLGEIESFTIDITAAELPSSVMGTDWAVTDVGLKTASGSISVLHDRADAGQATLTVGSVVTLTFFPEGETTGLTTISGSFVITSRSINSSATDIVKASYNFANNDAVTEGAVA
jgi:hypothetical protein